MTDWIDWTDWTDWVDWTDWNGWTDWVARAATDTPLLHNADAFDLAAFRAKDERRETMRGRAHTREVQVCKNGHKPCRPRIRLRTARLERGGICKAVRPVVDDLSLFGFPIVSEF